MSKEIRIEMPKGWSSVLASQIESSAKIALSSTLIAAKSYWEQESQKRLTTTRTDYLLGLNSDDTIEYPDSFTGVLTLRGKWPNMLESGFPAYDMKLGFKNGKRVKRKDDGGWYTTVPFRHRVPDTVGSAVGGQAMPDDIYSRAKVLTNNQRLTGTETNYPPRTSWTGYQHKSGIYEGIKKVSKTYDKSTQNQYFSFRRVSDKSDPDSWFHPGFPGVKLAEPVEQYAKRTFKQVLEHNIKKAMM